jgi:hypothetical protein
MEAHIKFYKVMDISAGLYGSKNWLLTEKDENRIQGAEMMVLRSTLEVTRKDRLTNEAVRKTLKVNSLSDTVSKYSWFNYNT